MHLVSVVSRKPRDIPSPAKIQKTGRILLNRICKLDKIPVHFEICVHVVSDKAIQKLNQSYRKKDKPTDVLSFPVFEAKEIKAMMRKESKKDLSKVVTTARRRSPVPREPLALGDIIISFETCRNQAKEIGHSVPDEFFRLFAHGLLHLLGYDHEISAKEEKRMMAREDELLMALTKAGF